MAPTGPRNAATSSRQGPGGGKTQRGGIAKRRAGGPVRVDRDGDLDMDSAAGGSKRPNNPPTGPRSKRPATTTGRAPKPTAKAQQIINKVITSGNGSISSRLANGIANSASARSTRSGRPVNAPNSMTLRVEGLKSSKAVNNAGGGLKELLTFLERKAQSVGKVTRPIRIKKVCVSIRS